MLENLPKHEPFRLADQVISRKYQVCSKSLCSIPGAEIMLLAFDGGEGVSAEQYFGDTPCMLPAEHAILNMSIRRSFRQGRASLCPPASRIHL